MATQGAVTEESLYTRRTVSASSSGLPADVGSIVAGKYRIERMIGQGAMGAVYAACHEPLQKRVALKILFEEHVHSSETVNRFFNEARAAAGIESDHVARVLDVGQLETGAPFMALELLEGADLAAVLQQGGRLSVYDVVDWILQALEALAEAHSLGIVHRDLKPANLFLARRRDGTRVVKVLDFGISKFSGLTGAQPTFTVTSSILGSPVYMAPEQLRNAKSVDARADIWAVGVVLYELLSGRLPFFADNVAELFVAVLEHVPASLQDCRADIPPELDEVVMRCLSRDLDARFQDVAELAVALAPFALGGDHPSVERIRHVMQTADEWTGRHTKRPRQRKRVHRLVAAAIAAVGVGGLATGLMAARQSVASHSEAQPRAPGPSHVESPP
ncbi:MAG TPA: serine/threonine-protein kinase [Polyangiaceae bacterium]|jgi:serine/threonine-protein kinase|nr:serine/threonine-protein kinase [Polyangiaceae bacterium]